MAKVENAHVTHCMLRAATPTSPRTHLANADHHTTHTAAHRRTQHTAPLPRQPEISYKREGFLIIPQGALIYNQESGYTSPPSPRQPLNPQASTSASARPGILGCIDSGRASSVHPKNGDSPYRQALTSRPQLRKPQPYTHSLHEPVP